MFTSDAAGKCPMQSILGISLFRVENIQILHTIYTILQHSSSYSIQDPIVYVGSILYRSTYYTIDAINPLTAQVSNFGFRCPGTTGNVKVVYLARSPCLELLPPRKLFQENEDQRPRYNKCLECCKTEKSALKQAALNKASKLSLSNTFY